MKGPYESSLREFVECVCEVLVEGESYTYNQARIKCEMSYRTVKDYATIEQYEANWRVAEKCRRRIKPEKIYKSYPGFRVVHSLGGGSLHSDPCTTELASEARRANNKSMEITSNGHSRNFYLSASISIPGSHLNDPPTIKKHTKHVFHVEPFLVV